MLWSVLKIFWGEERTTELQEVIFGPSSFPTTKTHVNSLGNLITLCANAHMYWNQGIFALKHIQGGSHQGTNEMELELEWQAEHPELDRKVRIDQATQHTYIQNAKFSGLTDCTTRKELLSGYRVNLTTSNPDRYPLPDERLIELQWLLSRVLKMSAAAEEDMNGDDSSMRFPAASAASVVTSTDSVGSFRTESPVAPPVTSPQNSLLPHLFRCFHRQSDSTTSRIEAKRLWKPAHVAIPLRGRRKSSSREEWHRPRSRWLIHLRKDSNNRASF